MSSIDHKIAKVYWSLAAAALVKEGVYLRNNKPVCWQTLELIMERSGYRRINVPNPILMVEPALHKFSISEK